MGRTTTHKFLLVKIMSMSVALLMLLLGYRVASFELGLRRYEKTFLQVEHPEHTERMDSLDLEVNYYPATYVDDSIQFQSAFLIGEIRSYDGNWDLLQAFYAHKGSKAGEADLLPLWTMPLQIERGDQRSWLDFPDGFFYEPLQADVLQALRAHYPSNTLTQQFGEVEGSLYFVYMLVDP
jgi:hypothetical protein